VQAVMKTFPGRRLSASARLPQPEAAPPDETTGGDDDED
jgi:hypothetical protein